MTIKSYNLGAAYGPKAVAKATKNKMSPSILSDSKTTPTPETSATISEPTMVEKQETEYAPEYKISMSAEEKTAKEIAVPAPVQQVEIQQEQQVVAPPPIVDEDDDDEEIVQKKPAPRGEAARKPKVEQKQKIDRNRFDKPIRTVVYDSGMDNDGYGK